MNNASVVMPPATLPLTPPPLTMHSSAAKDQQVSFADLPPVTPKQELASAVELISAYSNCFEKKKSEKNLVAHNLPLGPVKTIHLHRLWQENSYASKLYRRVQFELAGDPATRLTVRLSSLALSETTRKELIALVNRYRFRTASPILFADSIVKLAEFLGPATVGRNQYSIAKRPLKADEKSLFHLDHATLIWVKGQAAVQVEGKFVNSDDGKVLRHFIGAFIPYETHKGTMVMELSLTTAKRDAYLMHKAELKQILNTLVPADQAQ
jgi:hypothetical protein